MKRRKEDEQSMSDMDLVRGALAGDSRATELLYKRFFSFAMSICIRYTKNHEEAMELVNDSFMKVLANISDFDGSRSFMAWYGRILVNSSVDNYRKNSRWQSHNKLMDDQVLAGEPEDPPVHSELSAKEILSLFSHLPENYKIIFNLYEIEGYTHDEIALMLDISASASRTILSRAKKMLRTLYTRSFNPEKRSHE
ncbi:MAG TPA: sigma-70 family RNA polymerase sigma factor [Bacteroidales bacterium]|nr:sigma-70 family RNA polymerase sigma factor [Bacteroidales bacterium]HNY53503.1 sigma-70 family RNA polymerase sigma factor [Bacteroidales bacterium]HOG56056.1 sigma-70 family RNA polymerase sigma factor [Bacteroidales bacterium]